MKKGLLLLVFIIFISCTKKEDPKMISFDISFANREDSVYYDSVAFALIKYGYVSELKDTSDFNNPDFFSHIAIVERPYVLKLDAGQACIIKKFSLINKAGTEVFYVPYGTQYYYVDGREYRGFGLPFVFKVSEDAAYVRMVTKK